jgi:hypothetical protein
MGPQRTDPFPAFDGTVIFVPSMSVRFSRSVPDTDPLRTGGVRTRSVENPSGRPETARRISRWPWSANLTATAATARPDSIAAVVQYSYGRSGVNHRGTTSCAVTRLVSRSNRNAATSCFYEAEDPRMWRYTSATVASRTPSSGKMFTWRVDDSYWRHFTEARRPDTTTDRGR